MSASKAVLSCDIAGLVGGAAGNLNACWAYCQKKCGKFQWQWDGCSGIDMPAFEAMLSCNITGRVGGAAGNSNACWACCQKKRGKGQWDGCSGIEMPASEAVISCDITGRVGGLQVIRMLAGLAARKNAARDSGMGVQASKCLLLKQ